MQEKKTRKSYPTIDERLKMADERIENLTRLCEERRQLVARTETLLTERREALAKCSEQLEKVQARKERLIKQQGKKAQSHARAGKSEEKKRLDELLSVIKAKGLSLEEVVATLSGN